ncbi:MAG: hypothetical protein QXF12_03110 [Candidatus Aenigmatarchaeota archaeon]
MKFRNPHEQYQQLQQQNQSPNMQPQFLHNQQPPMYPPQYLPVHNPHVYPPNYPQPYPQQFFYPPQPTYPPPMQPLMNPNLAHMRQVPPNIMQQQHYYQQMQQQMFMQQQAHTSGSRFSEESQATPTLNTAFSTNVKNEYFREIQIKPSPDFGEFKRLLSTYKETALLSDIEPIDDYSIDSLKERVYLECKKNKRAFSIIEPSKCRIIRRYIKNDESVKEFYNKIKNLDPKNKIIEFIDELNKHKANMLVAGLNPYKDINNILTKFTNISLNAFNPIKVEIDSFVDDYKELVSLGPSKIDLESLSVNLDNLIDSISEFNDDPKSLILGVPFVYVDMTLHKLGITDTYLQGTKINVDIPANSIFNLIYKICLPWCFILTLDADLYRVIKDSRGNIYLELISDFSMI